MKYCKDCKYFSSPMPMSDEIKNYGRHDTCLHERSTHIDLVHGIHQKCTEMRYRSDDKHYCGPNAKWFEPIDAKELMAKTAQDIKDFQRTRSRRSLLSYF